MEVRNDFVIVGVEGEFGVSKMYGLFCFDSIFFILIFERDVCIRVVGMRNKVFFYI